MSLRIDASHVRQHLEARLGLRLTGGLQKIDGGIFPVVRPSDLDENHGFSVALARTPREVVASFHLDRYSGRLLRVMSDAETQSKKTFAALQAAAGERGFRVLLEVNGESAESIHSVETPWSGFGIEVWARLRGRLGPEELSEAAIETSSCCFALALSLLPIEEVDAPSASDDFLEGRGVRTTVNRYERNPASRAACISFHGCTCKACGFDFGSTYGAIADGFIHVHHLTPISQMGGEYVVDPLKDLVPLCANCHAVVHRLDPPLPIQDLRDRLLSQATRR